MLAGYASISTAAIQEARQALAPTGKLRVGLDLDSPTDVIRDSASGEMKGVGFDLGKELARRMEVPFEPVLYRVIEDLIANAKSGEWDVALLGLVLHGLRKWISPVRSGARSGLPRPERLFDLNIC